MGISTENFNKNPKGTLEKLENNLERIFKEYTFLEKKIHKHIYIYQRITEKVQQNLLVISKS